MVEAMAAASSANPAAVSPGTEAGTNGPCSRPANAPAGALFQAKVWGYGSDEDRAAALALDRAGVPLQLAAIDSPAGGGVSLPKCDRLGLERLTGQRVELAKSVLYQSGSPDDWNLEYHGRCRVGRTAF